MKLGLHKTARYYYYPGWHEPGTTNEFGFNKKAYEALPVDLRRMLDHAAAAVQVYGLTDYHAKNAIALERLRTEFKGKVEMLPLPVPVLRDLKKLAAEVVKEESEKSPMARKVHASFTKFQALVGPWDHVAEGAYHQFVARRSMADDRTTQVHREGERGRWRPSPRPPSSTPPTSSPSRRSSGGCPRPGPRRSTSAGRGPAAGESRRRDERRAVPDRGLPGRPDHAAVRVLRRRLPGQDRGVHGAATVLDGQRARDRVVRDHPVRHEPRGHGRLVLPGRRAQALGGGVRAPSTSCRAPPWRRSADGGMVQEEDQHDRRLQGPQDADREPRRQGRRPGGRRRPCSPRAARSMPRSSGA